jgi:hypothetical protein
MYRMLVAAIEIVEIVAHKGAVGTGGEEELKEEERITKFGSRLTHVE